jgi:hypothetical protein
MACPITLTVLFINSVKRRRRSHRLVRDDNQSSLSRRALLYSTERPLGQHGLHTLVSTPPDVAADISDNGEVTLRHAV